MSLVPSRALGTGGHFLIDDFMSCRLNSTQRFKMSSKKDTTTSSVVGQSGTSGWATSSLVRPYLGKPIELLKEGEFRDHFCFLNSISV